MKGNRISMSQSIKWSFFLMGILFLTLSCQATPVEEPSELSKKVLLYILTHPWEATYPGGITVDSKGVVYVANKFSYCIQKFTSTGQLVTTWGTSGRGNGQFISLYGIAVDASGFVYVTDTDNNRIQKFTSTGQFVAKWGSKGSGDGEFDLPAGITVDASGFVYVVDSDKCRIQKFTSTGQFVTTWEGKGR